MGASGELNIGQLAQEHYGNGATLVGFTTYTGTVTAASNWDAPAERKRVRPALDGSYEALFSRRATRFKELGLKNKQLAEKDYRNYILREYTFLKRPVVIIDDKIFAGSEKKTVEALKKAAK